MGEGGGGFVDDGLTLNGRSWGYNILITNQPQMGEGEMDDRLVLNCEGRSKSLLSFKGRHFQFKMG